MQCIPSQNNDLPIAQLLLVQHLSDMSHPLQFRIDGSLQDADEAADDVGSRVDFLDAVSSSHGSDSHTDSEGEQNEPADVRSFSHSYVLQAALQKNQSDPHFNPAHSKIKQPASILHDPPVSCLVGIGTSAVSEESSSERGSVSGPSERVLVAALRSEQQRYEEAPGAPSLSDENITAGRWIGECGCPSNITRELQLSDHVQVTLLSSARSTCWRRLAPTTAAFRRRAGPRMCLR